MSRREETEDNGLQKAVGVVAVGGTGLVAILAAHLLGGGPQIAVATALLTLLAMLGVVKRD